MRQWHRCDRWERHRIGCPFTVDQDHERAESDPEPLVFSKLYQKIPATPGVSGQPPAFETAAVVTKKGRPGLRAGRAAHVPQESYLDLLGIAEPNSALEPVLGKIVDAVTQIPRAWQAPRWITREDFAKIGIGDTSNVPVALAEEAVAEGVGRFPGQMLPFMAIPLIEAFRRFVVPAVKTLTTGVDAPYENPFRTGQSQEPSDLGKRRASGEPRGLRPLRQSATPPTTRGGGGLHVNMNEWFLQKFGAGPRRKASPTKASPARAQAHQAAAPRRGGL